MAQSGMKRAKVVEKLVNNREKMISSVLIGGNITTILLSSIATTIAIHAVDEENEALAVTIAAIVTTVVVLVFSDITPKVMASKHSEKIALLVAWPMVAVMFVLTPVNAVLNGLINKILGLFGFNKKDGEAAVTEQEVMAMLDMGFEEGVIPLEQSEMIDAVFEFRKAQARDVMIPRTDMSAIPITATYDQVVQVFRDEGYSRLPVYEDDLDHIIGMLNFKDFMLNAENKETFEVAQYIRDPFFSYENQSTQKLFANMRAAGATLAIVVDEYGGCAGLVTLEDLVETIMGEIFDEHDDDEDPDITCIIPDQEYDVLGNTRIDDFNKHTGLQLASDDYDTMAGYVMGLFGYIPTQGEQATEGKLTFIVEEVGKNRVEALKIKIEAEKALEIGHE